jgi:exonuclease III
MRIVTWNMGYWGHASAHEAAWRWLLDELSPDIALLQECVVPSWVEQRATVLFDRAYPNYPNQRWGTALVTKDLEAVPARLEEVETWLAPLGEHAPEKCSAARLRGWYVPAHVSFPDGSSALVISIHNPAFPIERELVEGRDLTGIKLALNPDVWLLDVVSHFLTHRLGEPLLIGGDFNCSRLLDDPTPRGNAEFFDRLTNDGFVSLHRRFHDSDEQTFFQPKKRGHQLDYLYTDATLASHATYCRVVPRSIVESYSDHAPVAAELTL